MNLQSKVDVRFGVYPNSNTREMIIEKGVLNGRVFRAYKGALDAFNAGGYTKSLSSDIWLQTKTTVGRFCGFNSNILSSKVDV